MKWYVNWLSYVIFFFDRPRISSITELMMIVNKSEKKSNEHVDVRSLSSSSSSSSLWLHDTTETERKARVDIEKKNYEYWAHFGFFAFRFFLPLFSFFFLRRIFVRLDKRRCHSNHFLLLLISTSTPFVFFCDGHIWLCLGSLGGKSINWFLRQKNGLYERM